MFSAWKHDGCILQTYNFWSGFLDYWYIYKQSRRRCRARYFRRSQRQKFFFTHSWSRVARTLSPCWTLFHHWIVSGCCTQSRWKWWTTRWRHLKVICYHRFYVCRSIATNMECNHNTYIQVVVNIFLIYLF